MADNDALTAARNAERLAFHAYRSAPDGSAERAALREAWVITGDDLDEALARRDG